MSLFIGLMSGTSADSIDAALVEMGADTVRLIATHRHPMPGELRGAVLKLFDGQAVTLRQTGELDTKLGELFGEAARALLSGAGVAPGEVTAIGSHGQTVYHHPAGRWPHTIQLGDPNIIAESTGITTVADFRRRDMAAGGEGAPLVPAFHAAILRTPDEDRAVVNIGGIANITVLPAAESAPILGFDCGPGNALMDAWAMRYLDAPMDRNGAWAASGKVSPALLDTLLGDGFFERSPPKSTGREYFNLAWLGHALQQLPEPDSADIARTLTELTVRCIAAALTRFAPRTRRLLVCGGGVRNPLLMARLGEVLDTIPVTATDEFGIAAQWVEAQAFAWLAHRTLAGQPGNIPSVTGARHPVVLGGIYTGGHART